MTRLAALVACTLLPAAASAAPIDYEMVTVGDAGNAADTTGYGAVGYEYRIGKYEVTISQYTDFLNAVAKADPYGLYDERMATETAISGISRSGLSGTYSYSVMAPYRGTPGADSPGDRPITYASWFDAARFANWMQNGQGTGDTETGAYTLGGATAGDAPARNPGATFFVPLEDEWYKAAFFKGGGTNTGYWQYATGSDTAPGNTIGSGLNQANYWAGSYAATQSASFLGEQNYLTNVGAFSGSPSAYGTFDQAGNAFEWNDLAGAVGPSRGLRGDYWDGSGYFLPSFRRFTADASGASNIVGFRLAGSAISAVPEIDPAGIGSVVSLLVGALGLLERRRAKARA